MWAADVLLFVLCAFATCALVIKPPSWVGVFSVWMVLAVALLTQALVPSGLRILGAT